MNIFKNIIDKVVDAFSSSKEFKINNYDETNYDDKIVPYNEILESKNGILIALLSKIAKSDGVISVNESNYISKQIDSFQIKEEIRHIYSKEIINQEKDNTSNIEELCKKFLVSNKNESKIFIKNLVDITKVDNKFDKNQYKMLSDIMTFINLPEDNIKEFQIDLLEKPNEECKKLYQKLYILKLEKEDVKGEIEEIEYKAFKNYGEIKLELLSLKKDLSKEFLEEYNNYLEFYNKYKNYTKKFDESLTNYKAYIDFHRLNMLTQMINNYKHDISLLQEEIKELKRNESYQMSLNFMIVNQYFNSEKELLKTELESIQNKKQNKSKIIVVTEDIELKKLKQQLKKLEIKFQQLIEKKTECLNDIEEFNTLYNIHLGELLKDILNLKKELLYKQTIKQQEKRKKYEDDIEIFNSTKENIEEIRQTIEEFEKVLEDIDEDDENYNEIFSSYKELQDELEKLEKEILEQQEKFSKIKEELEDDEIFKEYEESKKQYEQFHQNYEDIKQQQSDVFDITNEQKSELKKLWKKACKLCHPDIVIDKFKEKAHEIMQSLNDAYSKKDIGKVQEILSNLENGLGFEIESDNINDKEILKSKINEYKKNILELESEIENLKQDETYQIIQEIDDMDEYFKVLKVELQSEKDRLENDVKEILENTEENNIEQTQKVKYQEDIQTFQDTKEIIDELRTTILELKEVLDSIDEDDENYEEFSQAYNELKGELEKLEAEYFEEIKSKLEDEVKEVFVENIKPENSPYAKHIQSIENIKFEKIRKYCENLSKDNDADTMQRHLGEQGKMYKALMYSTLEVFLEKLSDEIITLCDWGCGQGIASMLVLDYIKEKQLDIKVSDVILIDDDTKALGRAMVQGEALAQNSIKFIPIKSDDNNISDTIKSNKNNIVLNLFANDKIPTSYWTINYDIFDESYFLCVSNENKEFVDEIYENINSFIDVENLSILDGKIGRFDKYERIFRIDNKWNTILNKKEDFNKKYGF